MNMTGLRQELETKLSKAIEESRFFEEKPWVDEGSVVGEQTIALAASAAVNVLLAVAESQEFAKREGYVKET